jgi:hypothetical protein
MALEPPPETLHKSEDATFQAVCGWAKDHGYGVKKHRVMEDKKGFVRRRRSLKISLDD